ncbi:hypothetical protein [Kutzneria sp. NPDC052558]|uniref:hypothetical protein n=1 Tax=Kutzneria sp. NPDC052558 TaxID=3364121 RepID=UPI0037C962EF
MNHNASTTVACVLGCRAASGRPYPAQAGYLTCDPCALELRATLRELVELYALTEDAAVPGAADVGVRTSSGYGPRSPAVDAVVALTDPRSATEDGEPVGVLGVLSTWADTVRADTGVRPALTEAERRDGALLVNWLDWVGAQPWAGAVLSQLGALRTEVSGTLGLGQRTVSGEVSLLVNWLDWITRQPWVADLAAEVTSLHRQMRAALGLLDKFLPVGQCPVDTGRGRTCGAALRVRVGAARIVCRVCGTSWPRAKWDTLSVAQGTPLSDTAELSAWLGVPAGTLRRWRSEDKWTRHGDKARPLYDRAEALASWSRRRANAAATSA